MNISIFKTKKTVFSIENYLKRRHNFRLSTKIPEAIFGLRILKNNL